MLRDLDLNYLEITMGLARYSFLALLAGLAFVLGWRELVREQQSVPDTVGWGRLCPSADEPEQALQAQIDRSNERIACKHAAVRRLLAGQWTLLQAAACFAELDRTQSAQQLAHWRTTCPGDTDEERYCWTILRFVAGELQDRPCQARAVRERLEGELPAHLRRRLADDFLSTEWVISRRPAGEPAESFYKWGR
jgi:hypothetical protein